MTPFQRRLPRLDGARVFLGMPVHRSIEGETHGSVVATIYAMNSAGIASYHTVVRGSSVIELARSRVCDGFLKTDATHLFMLDSDQTWEPKAFLRLLALGMEMPIVCGAYPVKRDPPAFFVNRDPHCERNAWGCVKVKGLGLGFACIQRIVIQKLADRAPKLKLPGSEERIAHIFRCDSENGAFRGEDMAFFADAAGLGYECWVDPSVRIGHVGSKEYKADFGEGL